MKAPARLSSVILYSVISAAFIGPGTITTAVTAGATHQLHLLWAVAFGTLGCILLQEVSARIVIATDSTLAKATQLSFGAKRGKGLMFLVGGVVMAGCAAYQAGNIMGAVAGLNLLSGLNTRLLTVLIAAGAFIVLWTNKRQVISWLMTALVSLMGIAFFILAMKQPISMGAIIKHIAVPAFPVGSELLILGLVGTTIVPYNIFLGSGISKGRTVPLMRLGLTVSVLVGGIITAAIVVAGTAVQGFTSFPELADMLHLKLGNAGALALGIGLFAAGFSSSITAPYAATIIASSLADEQDLKKLRWVWMVVLGVGFTFGISGVKPIPVILTVQALNGLILPLLVIVLVLVSNNGKVMPMAYRQSNVYNFFLLLILASVLLIGLNQVDKAMQSFGLFSTGHFISIGVLGGLVVFIVGIWAYRLRQST